MSAQILDGKALASAIKAELTSRVVALKAKGITIHRRNALDTSCSCLCPRELTLKEF